MKNFFLFSSICLFVIFCSTIAYGMMAPSNSDKYEKLINREQIFYRKLENCTPSYGSLTSMRPLLYSSYKISKKGNMCSFIKSDRYSDVECTLPMDIVSRYSAEGLKSIDSKGKLMSNPYIDSVINNKKYCKVTKYKPEELSQRIFDQMNK